VSGTTLTVTTPSGLVTRTTTLQEPAYDFALSNDGKLLVTAASFSVYGGPLALFRVQSGQWSRLTSGPVYFTRLERGEKEVYADPRFSPDGSRIAFAIHLNSSGDDNDVIDASGPIAVMDLSNRRVRVLKSTTNIDGNGPCFANTPLWSPDGKRLLFSCETGGAVTDAGGTTLRQLEMGTDAKSWTAALGWVGNSCVLYVQGVDGSKFDTYEARLLNLRTHESQDATTALKVAHEAFAGLMEATEKATIRRTNSDLYIDTPSKHWTLPGTSHAHLTGGWSAEAMPPDCQ
jgi:WD40 repeat protein